MSLTQAYGVANARYPLTGRHIGTDYAVPVGTALVAPMDGQVTTAGTHPALGNFCHFEYTLAGQKWEQRWCHLVKVPLLGSYRRGDAVAFSGNTGDSSGPHAHIEKWRDDVRTDLINRSNWSTLTADPEA